MGQGQSGLQGDKGDKGDKGDSALMDFDMFTNGNDAKFSTGWQIGGESIWDPVIRGPSRTGFAHTENKDNLGPDFDDNITTNRTADIKVPGGMKSGFLFHLPWNNCREFDIWGVLNGGEEVFIRRVNAYQNARNDQRAGLHDGVAIVPIPRVDRFTDIRIKGVRGRIHYMGTGWTKSPVQISGADSGFVSARNVIGSAIAVGDIPAPQDWTGANFRRKDGRWTHFDWKDDQRNYIRGETVIDNTISLQNNQLRFREIGDGNHYLGFSVDADGPRLQGHKGGQLGTNFGGDKSVLSWNADGNVKISGTVDASGFTINGKPISAGLTKDEILSIIRSGTERYEQIDGIDYPGNDIGCPQDPSGEECKKKCSEDKNCKGYLKAGWGCCYKHTLANKQSYDGTFFVKK